MTLATNIHLVAAITAAAFAGAPAPIDGPACAAPPDPMLIRLVPTANANGASGEVRLHFAASPFGVSATRDGRHDFSLALVVEGLSPPPGTTVVVWAATPDLGQVRRLGVLGADGTLEARIALNKFLVFLTAEDDPEVQRWTGPVLLRGSSPSGRMHSMAGHGPFEGEPCAVIGF
jgi:hypothetical protein